MRLYSCWEHSLGCCLGRPVACHSRVSICNLKGSRSLAMLLPMLGACFTAMLVPTLMRDEPIYEALRKHMLRANRVP